MDVSSAASAVHRPGRGRVFDSIVDAIGDTPIVRLRKLPQAQGAHATILPELEDLQSGSEREGPHRRRHDHRDGEGGLHQRRHRAHRAHLGKHRHCARVCRGLARLPAEAGDAGFDVDRTAQDAGVPRRDRVDAGGAGHEGIDRDGRGTAVRTTPNFRDAAAIQEPANPAIHLSTTAEEIWTDRRRQRGYLCLGRRHRRHDYRRAKS